MHAREVKTADNIESQARELAGEGKVPAGG